MKSEQLWPGHLKSLNHRKNVQRTSEHSSRPAKRKIESVEDGEGQERNYEVDSRKKPKSAPESQGNSPPVLEVEMPSEVLPTSISLEHEPQPSATVPPTDQQTPPHPQVPPAVDVDEDEWAAFERDVAEVDNPDFASAIIEAAPVSAAQLAEQQRTNTVQQREDEAEAEKADESRRMEEEFEVMEEMEDRVKRLRARREALRTTHPITVPTEMIEAENEASKHDTTSTEQVVDDKSSEVDEVDDWYA